MVADNDEFTLSINKVIMGTMSNFVISLSFLIKFTEPLPAGFAGGRFVANLINASSLNKRVFWRVFHCL